MGNLLPNGFHLTERKKIILEARGYILLCDYQKCRKPLKPGEEVVSLISEGLVKRRMHKKCYEKMFV